MDNKNKAATPSDKKPHYLNHRKRVKEKLKKSGLLCFADYEVLEFLLFYAIPRVDTKPKAKELLERFGSLENVISAPIALLMDAGLSEHTAIFLRLFHEVPEWNVVNAKIGKKLKDFDEIGRYLVKLQKNDTRERLVALFLDSKNVLKEVATICEGNFSSAHINKNKLMEIALTKKYAKVVLSHNHPSGIAKESFDDVCATHNLENALAGVDVSLIEHYVVAGGEYIGIKRNEEEAERQRQIDELMNLPIGKNKASK